ncbi:MAG: TIGR03936 family radical SAM-associated protein [Spirochaetaceae bacterium]|nr:TIGR03936 family radical SAM-associated protein [Spirochaetaceae bacterium]
MTRRRFINPLEEFGPDLLSVQNPARYVGGEALRLAKKDASLQTIAAFPDLYEIGMSNQALKILYNRVNSIEGASCDRAFAPAPDFDKLLDEKKIPLYGLDTGLSLKDADILMFTFGYELGVTSLLAMLKRSFIPIKSAERGDGDPIILAGGVCASNPAPYSRFIDGFWIGEAEDGFFETIEKIASAQKNGAQKKTLFSIMQNQKSLWSAGKEKAVRAVYSGFSQEVSAAINPVPSMKVAHGHGFVEIMRGCPNGCRFCHAGVWYKPMRQKDEKNIILEVEQWVNNGGYREITLSSLSSADYNGVYEVTKKLNQIYKKKYISFQLPSLHVSTFSLPLLEEISRVRKSGLTFAVETPGEEDQKSINKSADEQTISEILFEAKKRGWKSVKFYFMLGLPDIKSEDEAQGIIDFIKNLSRKTRMNFSINIGVFIPKAHTPYQRAAQIKQEEAEEKIKKIIFALKPLGHKVSAADAFVSKIEGVLSRGGEEASYIIEEAFNAGCALDAWSEYFKRDAWEKILQEKSEIVEKILSAKKPEEKLPWDCIESGTAPSYIEKEAEKSKASKTSPICQKNCANNCGVCGESQNVCYNIRQNKNNAAGDEAFSEKGREENLDFHNIAVLKASPCTYRMIFSYSKEKSAVFLSHLSVIEVFSASFLRSQIEVSYSEGFNPLPRLDFASPLALGISGENEIASIDLNEPKTAPAFIKAVNPNLPEGFTIKNAACLIIKTGEKKISPASVLWGFAYKPKPTANSALLDYIEAKNEKKYRAERETNGESLFYMKRKAVLAKQPAGPGFEDYFTFYKNRYPCYEL